ncbi:MAG: TIGR02281 family clan AA aspartic protease [Pseudomonadota bacterium]
MSKFTYLLVSAMLISALVGGVLGTPAETIETPEKTLNVVSATSSTEPERQLAPDAAYISRRDDGHYWSNASVDGTSVEFLVDTGASVVALTWRDAQRLRLRPQELDFKWAIRTANGETYGASVLLESVRIGNVRIENVEAMVMQDGLLEKSLLGMSFLGELYSYEFKGDTMIIRK